MGDDSDYDIKLNVKLLFWTFWERLNFKLDKNRHDFAELAEWPTAAALISLNHDFDQI